MSARRRVRASSGPRRNALVLAVLATLAAHGRAGAAEAEAGAPALDGASRLGRIEVVGSRIKRVDIETSQPVLVLERADLDRTGLATIGDILQQIVVNGSNLNARINNGGDGEVRVSLRNLGANRTLVLVNGRRWVPELDGAVDLSTIPLAVIERVEVLKDGASAIYGSDAIAGVINITTRRHYDGAEAHGYWGKYEQGDGETYATDVTIGTDSERGSVALSASYQKQEPVWAGDRAISAVPVYGLPGNDGCAGASGGTPNGRFRVPGRDNGAPIPCLDGAPPLLTLIEGRSGTSPADFRPWDIATEAYNFAPANYLLTPSERTSLYAQARYDVGRSIGFSTEALFSQRRSAQLLAPSPISINPAIAGALGNTVISANNLYNPFHVPIGRFSRRFEESGGRRFSQDRDTYRFSGGFDGTFLWGEREFSWEAHALYSRNEQNESIAGGLDLRNTANALGPSFLDELGVPRCGVPGNVVEGCVPLNVFGGAGSITDAMGDYIQATTQSSTEDELWSYAANVTGDLFQLPAGPLGMATGYEFRRVRGEFVPDALIASGLLAVGGSSALPTSGGYAVDEAYVELNLPLLADKPFAETLELSLAARYSDYSNFGSTINAKAGFRWKPHKDVLVRGNWSEGFRAPSVLELFQGEQSDFGEPLDDPCDAAKDPTAAVQARCAQLGVPASFEQPDFTNFTVGGNPELQPETAITRTLGVVYSPSWVTGLDLYLDWYRITIDEAIGALQAQAIVNRCYTLFDDSACARVTRNDAGQLFIVDATLQNVREGTETEGFDFTLNYRFTTPYGKFAVRSDTAYVDYFGEKGRPERLSRRPDGTLLTGNVVATLPGNAFFTGTWRIKSNLALTWSRGDWSASVTGRYFSPLEEDCNFIVDYAGFRDEQYRALCDDPDRIVDLDGDGIGDQAATHEIDDVWFFDLQAGWDTPWNGHLTLGLRNAFDRAPPISRNSFNSFDPAYDIPGRFWYAEYTQRF